MDGEALAIVSKEHPFKFYSYDNVFSELNNQETYVCY
jgi:hypothetical protein